MPKMENSRSLYQCSHAKVLTDKIYCEKGHRLNSIGSSKETGLSIRMLERGSPLRLRICNLCIDYDEMGGPVAAEDRGWLKHIKEEK